MLTMQPEVITLENIVERDVTQTVYRYPNTPPYQEIADPIDYEEAMALLQGMKASHIQVLHWTFENKVGFGIDDRDFQERCVKWYDQLIEYVQRERM